MNCGRDEALARVARAPDNNYHGCLAFAVSWLYQRPSGDPFTMGELRAAARTAGIAPREPRVWGAVTKRLQREKLIRSIGISTNGRSHGGFGTSWRRLS
jgi:hypothetical protein